jgi:nicotinamidase/pyrazinamidase
MATELHLLIVDPQNDFCDPAGALHVPGAGADMDRLAGLLERLQREITAVHVTLDSHTVFDVAHPIFWRDSVGRCPDPFTPVTAADVRSGRWNTSRPVDRGRALSYLEALEQTGRYSHTIWPEHCLLGTPGHNVWPRLAAALHAWEREHRTPLDFVLKGSNPWTEHFSAVRAEVPDPEDPGTAENVRLLQALRTADRVLLAGEALSHCVANTVHDLAALLDGAAQLRKLVLLTDATSPVPGPTFEQMARDFLAEFRAQGMQTATTEDFRA